MNDRHTAKINRLAERFDRFAEQHGIPVSAAIYLIAAQVEANPSAIPAGFRKPLAIQVLNAVKDIHDRHPC